MADLTPQVASKKKWQGPLLALGALVVAGGALAFIAFGNLSDNLVYYWSPSDMLAKGTAAYGPTIRLGGLVVAKSIEWNPGHTALTFKVADSAEPTAKVISVACEEVPPQMFREGIGVVVEGTYDSSHVFKSSRLMVNHSNEYRPPKPGEDMKEWMKSLEKEQSEAKM
jgi:cytochrome c-type biogenesis protein CcmE